MTGNQTLSSYLDAIAEYPVFLAHNANVDAMRGVDESLESTLEPPAGGEPAETLDAPADLSRRIADAMSEGEGNLVAMSESFAGWLEDNLDMHDTQLGGQAGIMADLLSVMDADPVLYTYLLTETQRSLFTDPDAIRFPVVDGDSLTVRPLGEVTNADQTKINWIFEFEEGDEFYEATAATDSRFIAAARPDRVNLETGLEPVAGDLAEEVECALLSGFHSLKKEYEDGTTYVDRLEQGRRLIRRLKEGTDLPVQMEYGVTQKEGLREEIAARILPEVDAVGMDSRELSLLIDDLDLDDVPEGDDVITTYEQLERVREEVGVDCMKLHRTHYFLAATDEDYLPPEAVKKGWDFASITAAAKATVGTIDAREDLTAGLDVARSGEGRDAVADLADHVGAEVGEDDAIATDEVVAVPNRVVADPDGTVGLGDSVAIANFALEQALAERTQQSMRH